MSARKFRIDLERAMEEKKQEISDIVVTIGRAIVESLVDKSPVDTGRFRGNWNVSIGIPDTHTTRAVDPSGADTKARGYAKLEEYKLFEDFPVIHFGNYLAYAGRLEDGHSKQAPSGVAGPTAVEVSAKYKDFVL